MSDKEKRNSAIADAAWYAMQMRMEYGMDSEEYKIALVQLERAKGSPLLKK